MLGKKVNIFYKIFPNDPLLLLLLLLFWCDIEFLLFEYQPLNLNKGDQIRNYKININTHIKIISIYI